MSNNPELSIIIVNYNGGKLLRDTLVTLQQYTKDLDYEIILIDNASTKGDVEKEIKGIENLKLIKNKSNDGFAKANNTGAKHATGEYLLLLNNDMIFTEDVIKTSLNYLKSLKGKYFVGPKLLNKDGSHQISINSFDSLRYVMSTNLFLYLLFPKSEWFNKYYLHYRHLSTATEVDIVKGAFMMMRKKDFEELGGFDENFFFYGEESDLCYRFKKSGGKVIYYPQTGIIHVGGGVSKKMPWFMYKWQASAKIRFYRKHFPLHQYIPALLFHYSGLILRIPVYLALSLIKFDKEILFKSFFYLRQIFVYPEKDKQRVRDLKDE